MPALFARPGAWRIMSTAKSLLLDPFRKQYSMQDDVVRSS